MLRYLITVVLFASFFTDNIVFGQVNFYSTDTIQDIEITFPNSNWDYMMDTAKYGSGGYILATQVKVNGVIYDSVGVKYKGNSSYDSTVHKNPLHIKLSYIRSNANYYGYNDIKLSNGFSDPSSQREVLAYDILRNYMHAPQCNFARVKINGIYYGLYSSSEDIDTDFLSTHFYSSGNTFIKCNPQSVVSGQIPNLVYLGTDSANYYSRYELKSSKAWKHLINLCDTLANQTNFIETVLDIDRALWMLAFNNVTVNLDSYSGAFAQNYYLYRDNNMRFNPVIWDLNMCFGGFQNTGSGLLNIGGMQQMTPLLHSSNGARPLIQKLLSNPFYLKMYIAHMRTITDEFFSNGLYLNMAQNYQTLIDSSVQVESYSLYTYSQFQQSLNTNFGVIPGISNLMSNRSVYLSSTTQFQQVPPTIANISSHPTQLSIYDTVWISTDVSNVTNVYLGYRNHPSQKFTRVVMFDDGLHHDGAASDGNYGAYFVLTSALMQYYIYSENSNAGIFSPVRAEHEFYTITANVATPIAGDLVINEFLAKNNNGAVDEAGQHEDWIELYNLSGVPLRLLGLYITDDYANPQKCPLPDVILPSNGYFIIWADEDNASFSNSSMHCNFKLSENGEKIMLSNFASTVLDSISFVQQSADISFGRCPNGTGIFTVQPFVTFAYSNCGLSVDEQQSINGFVKLFPNPATTQLHIISNEIFAEISVTDNNGKPVLNKAVGSNVTIVDINSLANGIYFCLLIGKYGDVIKSSKFIIAK